MGVIREHPLRRKTTGFRGVAPGITGGAIGSGLFLPKARSVQQTRAGPVRRRGWRHVIRGVTGGHRPNHTLARRIQATLGSLNRTVRSRLLGHGLRRVRFDQLLQLLAGFEVRDLLRCHVHWVAGPRVTSLARRAATGVESCRSRGFRPSPPQRSASTTLPNTVSTMTWACFFVRSASSAICSTSAAFVRVSSVMGSSVAGRLRCSGRQGSGKFPPGDISRSHSSSSPSWICSCSTISGTSAQQSPYYRRNSQHDS